MVRRYNGEAIAGPRPRSYSGATPRLSVQSSQPVDVGYRSATVEGQFQLFPTSISTTAVIGAQSMRADASLTCDAMVEVV